MADIGNLFGFIFEAPYDQRKVARDEFDVGGFSCQVDTVAVSDSEHPFETAVSRGNWNDGKWIIVQEYDSLEDAVLGHANWVRAMKKQDATEPKDVSSCLIAKLDRGEVA